MSRINFREFISFEENYIQNVMHSYIQNNRTILHGCSRCYRNNIPVFTY